jgi:hypothetical protein
MTDNAPDVMFTIASNAPVHLGIGKDSVTSKPSKVFPYVPAAFTARDVQPDRVGVGIRRS